MATVSRETATTLFRLRRLATSLRWIVLSTVLATIGLLGVWVPIPEWINLLLAGISFALLALEIRDHRRSVASIVFQPRESDSFQSVVGALDGNSRFTVRQFPHGSFVSDNLVSAAIRSGLKARLDPTPYSVPPSLRVLGERFLDDKLKSKHVFDGPILGWNTNVGVDPLEASLPSFISFRPATYFQHISTDQLALHDVSQDGRFVNDHGRRLFLDRRGNLRDLGDSWLVNVVGTSVMAFTSDGKLLVVDQGIHNLNSGGLLAPSGSGALEPRDFQGPDSLTVAALAANGANRELQEETGVLDSEIAESYFLGFGRWLDKAARPELMTLSLLTVDSHELEQRMTQRLEKPFVRGRTFTRLTGNMDLWKASPELMLEPQLRGRLSLPLSLGLSLLADFVGEEAEGSDLFADRVLAAD